MPRLLLLLLLLLAADANDTRYNGGTCQASFPCGANVNIHYPFFLDNATMVTDGYTAFSYCGYPGMAVACDEKAGRATLWLKGDNYTVLDIDYDNHTVTVADPDVLDAGGDCPRVTHNVTVPEETWLKLSTAANDNLVFFFDCAFAAGTPKPPPAALPPINCSGFREGSGMTSFVAAQPDVPPKDSLTGDCRAVITVPVLKYWLGEYLPRLNDDGYGKVLKHGFQLTWDPSAGPCTMCENSGGLCSYSQGGDFLGCLCPERSVGNLGCVRPAGNSKKKTKYIISFVTAGSVLLSVLLLACALYRKKFQASFRSTPGIESFLQKHEVQNPKRYTYSDLKRITKSFTHKLGQGGFGTVYKGNLPNGHEVAVKLLKNSKDDGKEFMNEVASIMKTSHVNVVALLGYCLQGSKRALIYEYMPKGSLERFAFGQNSEPENSLSWENLFDITVGIARGLEYLHRGCSTRIVHFDIKPHNILLDQNFCPKISDFGLAKLCLTKESIISIDGARGTIGYIAPEVFSQQFGQISSKSDVYSYGMMVLELVGARKNVNKNNSEASSKYFPQWVYEHLEEYCVNSGEIGVDSELVRKLIVVGLWCIQLQPGNRPTMTRVVEMLESRANDLQVPPQSLLC